MAPLIAAGAYVAYSEVDSKFSELDGRLVVAWIEDEAPIVRWYQSAGRLALLRTEGPEGHSGSRLIELDGRVNVRFRAVCWISTPR
jgi:hypothetical protein